MTEEQLGGTTPEPGAVATVADQAPEDTVTATAVNEPAANLDEPAPASEAEDVALDPDPGVAVASADRATFEPPLSEPAPEPVDHSNDVAEPSTAVRNRARSTTDAINPPAASADS